MLSELNIDLDINQTSIPSGYNIIKRTAIRAIIIKDSSILLVKSKEGDYKLPGGGVEKDETHLETLIREVYEETRRIISTDIKYCGKAIDVRADKFEKNTYFKMNSEYYIAELEKDTCLDNNKNNNMSNVFKIEDDKLYDYNKDDDKEFSEKPGDKARFYDIREAINENKALFEKYNNIMPWLERETRVLEIILSSLV